MSRGVFSLSLSFVLESACLTAASLAPLVRRSLCDGKGWNTGGGGKSRGVWGSSFGSLGVRGERGKVRMGRSSCLECSAEGTGSLEDGLWTSSVVSLPSLEANKIGANLLLAVRRWERLWKHEEYRC
jgi:hypothetical protein